MLKKHGTVKLYFNPLLFLVEEGDEREESKSKVPREKRQRQSEERQSLITLSLEVDFLEGF